MAKRASDAARRSAAAKLGWARKRAAAAKRSAAAKAGWATRRRNAEKAKRAAAAAKGWATRRKNAAKQALDKATKRPGGKNVRGKTPVPYQVRKYGITYAGKRYDFRGLTRSQWRAMLQKACKAAVGHYMRMLIATTDPLHAQKIYVGTWAAYERRHLDPSKPYWFWTSEYGPVESSMDAYAEVERVGAVDNPDVKLVILEVL